MALALAYWSEVTKGEVRKTRSQTGNKYGALNSNGRDKSPDANDGESTILTDAHEGQEINDPLLLMILEDL